jgi:hypothetical protein
LKSGNLGSREERSSKTSGTIIREMEEIIIGGSSAAYEKLSCGPDHMPPFFLITDE